ncbi:MAG: CocE/NonD family hydrolase [Planctomycetota bacterium]|nr:CocE/NonD family hydrolase [Planctomycetota bacterium]
MSIRIRPLNIVVSLLWISVVVASVSARQAVTVENSSSHQAISTVAFEGVELESIYLTMSDGVKLAADIFRPSNDGVPNIEALPLVWTHHRYVRARKSGTRRFDTMANPEMRELVRRGYIVAAVDVRGGGASFGHYEGPFTPRETQDAKEIIEWFASQDWCDGNIGMYGGSYLGATQYMAAAMKTPYLKAIIPSVAPADLYAFSWAGGIYRDAFLREWTNLTIMLDNQVPVAPVDADPDGEMLVAARSVRSNHRNTDEQFKAAPRRDSIDAELNVRLYEVISPINYLDQIESSGVAIYHLAGWMDTFVRDQLLLFANLDNPQRIAIGPWFHQQRHEFDNFGEHIRWYDRYLKGIDNGIDQEPPVQYYVMGASKGQRWRTAQAWPLPQRRRTTFYLHARAIDRHDGLLSRKSPNSNPGRIEYDVDYSTTTGLSNRWRNAHGGPGDYSDMNPNDEKGLSFTSAPLAGDIEITGHPKVSLWIESTADDGDFFVYLEEVDAEGVSNYITEGSLRASHRKTTTPDFEYFDLPYHRSFSIDLEPLEGKPVLLEFDLHPTSNLFDEGHRIRVTITCADRDNQDTPELDPVPTITLHCHPDRASSIVLPIIPIGKN